MKLHWVPAEPSLRLFARFVIAAFASLALALHLLPSLERTLLGHGPACLMKLAFGVPCLACRGTRALFSLAHARPLAAWTFNPLITLFLLTILGGSLTVAFTGKVPHLELDRPWRQLLVVVLVFLFLGNWLYVVRAGG